jgi:hypothetical protein
MSQLLKSDIKNKEHIVRLALSLDDNDPFAEFNTDSYINDNYSKLHLGECPSLKQHIDNSIIKTCYSVIFFINRPKKGKPFIQYYVEKTPYNTLMFPIIKPEHLNNDIELDIIGDDILNKSNNTIIKLGYFPYDVKNGIYYSFYEVRKDNYFNYDEELIDNNFWITPKEIMNKYLFNISFEKHVEDFITIGEGASRLYIKGEFIPSPEIVYIGNTDDFVNNLITNNFSIEDKKNILIGDLNVGILGCLFNIINKDGKIRINSNIKNGSLLRLAYWTKESIIKSKTYLIKDSIDKNFNLNFYDVNLDDCEILSRHYGRIIDNEITLKHIHLKTFLEILKSKKSNLFIFE